MGIRVNRRHGKSSRYFFVSQYSKRIIVFVQNRTRRESVNEAPSKTSGEGRRPGKVKKRREGDLA
jgi:hypothetical protein